MRGRPVVTRQGVAQEFRVLNRQHIVFRKEFADRTSFRGTNKPSGIGRLRGEDEARFDRDLPSITYVVYSYLTPIAWYCDRGWVVPSRVYTPITTSHQAIVTLALIQNRVDFITE